MADLLPCPWCESPRVGEPIRRRPLQVTCIDCGAEGPEALTHDDAIAAWNTRATPKPADPIPGIPPLNSIPVMLSEHMEPGAMLLVCGSTAFARIKAQIPKEVTP